VAFLRQQPPPPSLSLSLSLSLLPFSVCIVGNDGGVKCSLLTMREHAIEMETVSAVFVLSLTRVGV